MPPSWLSAAGSVAAGLVRERQLHSFGMASCGTLRVMTVVRSIALFVLAAIAEIGGAWLVWQGVREHRGLIWVGAGVVALGGYGFVATLQPDSHFGRILAAYGGIFVAGSLIWGMVADGFRPDRFDVLGAIICLIGVVVIMYVRPGA
jgi:small multidrug resistance family-3 protein